MVLFFIISSGLE